VEVVELGVREEEAKTMAMAEVEGRACYSHPLTPQLCLQSGVGATDTLQVVQVLLMAQELGAKAVSGAPLMVVSMVPMGLMTEAMGVGVHNGRAPAVLEAQALSSFATFPAIALQGR
jgi:hypothetical protein